MGRFSELYQRPAFGHIGRHWARGISVRKILTSYPTPPELAHFLEPSEKPFHLTPSFLPPAPHHYYYSVEHYKKSMGKTD